jgi:nucleoside 2-deoxyribosyltransferase
MKDEERKIRCALLIPRSDEFSSLREEVAAALRENGVEVLSAEGTVADEVPDLRSIARADFLIADLTKGDPDVMYEIGVAHGWRKPVDFLMRRDAFRIPPDLRGNLVFVYDEKNRNSLRRFVRSLADERRAVQETRA